MDVMSVLRRLVCFPAWLAILCAQPPPEIVALTPAPDTFHPVFREGPAKHTSTWHPGCPVPPSDLREVEVSYWDFGALPRTGAMVVHRALSAEVIDIFRELFHHGFLIQRMDPVDAFSGNDDLSMEANNTSAFNCRDTTGRLGVFSNHSWGRAIDINPLTNPYINGDKVLPPAGRAFLDRTRATPGAILAGSFIVNLFQKRGWTWGGSWKDHQDYQHFEKPDRR
jgi:hypothetical protein